MVFESIQRQTRRDMPKRRKSQTAKFLPMGRREVLRPYGRKIRRLEVSVTKSRLFGGGPGREGLGLFRELGEAGHVLHSHIREHLAIDPDAGGLQAVNELAVGQAILASGGTDALDPQAAILALLHAAIALCIAIRAIGGLLSGLVELALGEEEAFGTFKVLLAPSPALCAAFYAWHGFSPFSLP
jgi:hypothetical protein